MFKKAQRKKAKLRLGLCGPSGSGKTLSSLLVARGLAPTGRIAMIDTENGSGELYSDKMEYDVATLTAPFSPDRYISLIRQAEQAGYDVLIIDSLTHAWAGSGGILAMHDMAIPTAKGNTWAAWREVTPEHNALVDAILQSNMHVIATMRTKTAYEVVEENGKKKPIKIGLAPVQKEGMEYEFTVVLDLTIEKHIASVSKDRTGLLDGMHFIPSIETGRELLQWLDSGVDITIISQEQLAAMKLDANLMTSVETLKAWWQTQAPRRSLLIAEHLEELKQHCAARKAAILKDSLYEDQKPEGNPPPSPDPAPGGQPGPQDTPQGTPPGTPPPPVSAPDAGEEPATDEQVAAVRRLAVDTGVTNERLAAWVKAASKDITEDPAALTMKALAAVQKKIEATIKPGKQVTVEGTIMPDGYAVDNQAHIFDTDALDRGEFIEA
jgi:hypothetical protein